MSVIGVVVFGTRLKTAQYQTRDPRPDNFKDAELPKTLEYWQMFESFHKSFLTLFVIFTNDHW